jgi:predicted short-subunit dehydrogenase-like oxidoreductase (DUF2520 family)
VSARIFVLGAGRAGLGLTRALRASGADVIGVHGRHDAGGPDGITTGALPDTIHGATVVLVTVRDAQLDDALRELAGAGLEPETVVLHASGSATPGELETLRSRGHPCGTFHPLLPLADPSRAPTLFHGAWIGIDGDPAAMHAARALADRLGAHVLEIPRGAKARYHAAAVLASNFPVVLLALSEQLLTTSGVEGGMARAALRPLFLAAADNAASARDAAAALTGPIVRGDAGTVRAHLEALRGDPEMLEVYLALARAAVDVAGTAGVVDDGRLREVRGLLG